MERLPVDIRLDILSRLPTESVLESKLVPKACRDVIRDATFSQKHLNRLISAADDDSGNSGFLFVDINEGLCKKRLYYVDYNENSETPVTSTRRINLPSELEFLTIVGSCNGLICLVLLEPGLIVVCNPISREYVHLPRLENHLCWHYGFGYLVSTNEYKVVRIYAAAVEVYTLGSGNGWRNVGKLPEYVFDNRIGVFANGALHWVGDIGERLRVVAFDLSNEKFCEIPLPTQFDWKFDYDKIGSLGDYLMCSNYIRVGSGRSFDIWLLKENGIHEMNGKVDYKSMSWSKEFNIDNMRPFALTNNGAVLCFDYYSDPIDTLYRYDLKSSSLETLVTIDGRCVLQLSAHMKTLVSLKALGEENTKRLERYDLQSSSN